MEDLLIAAYWGKRSETINSASVVIYNILNSLYQIDKRFEEVKFNTLVRGVDNKIKLTLPKDEVINKLSGIILEDSRSSIRKYHPGITPSGDFHEPVGFGGSFLVKQIKPIVIRFHLGDYSEATGVNNVIVKIKKDYDCNYFKIESFFKAIIQNSNPDWGVVVPDLFLHTISRQNPPDIFVGWMNFFKKNDTVEKNLKKVNFELFESGYFTFLTNKEEVFSSENSLHVSKAVELIRCFKEQKVTRKIFKS